MRVGGLTLVAVGLAAASVFCSTARATSVTELPLATGGWLAVDGPNDHVFVSGGTGTTEIVVLDFDGNIVDTIADEEGASGLVLDEASAA